MANPAGTIQIVEDEQDLATLVRQRLEREGFRAVVSADGAKALEDFAKERPDLVLLDLMLPVLDGKEVCRRIRAGSRVPIIMLTARGEETDKIVGLELGADDYLGKPFGMGELVARVRALLRRAKPEPPGGGVRKIKGLEIDLDRYVVRVDGAEIELTPREFGLLSALLKAGGRVLSREDLLTKVWGYQRAADLDTRTVDQHVSRLRTKLGSQGDLLLTIKGVGYRLDLPAAI